MSDAEDMMDPGSQDPKEVAEDQFIHGLLEFVHKDDPARQRARVDRVMAALDGNVIDSEPLRPIIPLHGRPHWQRIAALAVPAIILISVFILSRTPSAASIVDSALFALSEQGDRRYQVVAEVNSEGSPPALTGNLDIRDHQHLVMQAQTQDGFRVVMGRDPEGDWLVHYPNSHASASIERLVQDEAWPRWLNLDAHAVPLDSVDNLLRHLHQDYEISHAEHEPIHEHLQGKNLARIVAHRKHHDAAAPDRVDVWIHRERHVVQRMELRWSQQGLHERHGLHEHPGGEHHPPHFVKGRPHFSPNGLHALHRMVFELVEHSGFGPNWFDPKSHSK